MPNPNAYNGNSSDIVKEFQLSNLSIAEKSSEEFGLRLSKYISSTVYSGMGGYYFARNARFLKNRNYANGRLDVQAMFADRFDFNGKQNYLNIGWQAIQIVNRIISGQVGRWMDRKEKISVKATDSSSVKDKQDEFEQLEFVIANREKLEQLQKESGVQIIPQGENLPQTKDELLLWQAQFQRLPEEILNEIALNDINSQNGLYDVIKEKLLWDDSVTGLVGLETWMDKEGVIHHDYCKPENIISSYTEYPDFRDTTWRGLATTIKISEIRKKYGIQFGGKLTEKQLWDIAATSKNYKKEDNITWIDDWTMSYMRPYDEWNVDSFKYEFKSVDSEKYVVTNTKLSNSTIIEKGTSKTASGKSRTTLLENQEVISDTGINIYRGVYLPKSETLLEWGLKDNMIRPQDPREIGNAEFSFSFYMYQNSQMRNIAIPEKIEQPVNGMILALLKIEQLVTKMVPIGAAIDTIGLQNIDFGLGDIKNKEVDYQKLYNQTGNIYYRSIDAEGNKIPVPIQELTNSGFLPQMDGLMKLYQFHYGTLKDMLGEDPNLLQQALQPRVTASNVDVSQQQGEFATNYIYTGYAEVIKMASAKASCLLKNSVTFGAKVYRELIKEEDIKDRIFTTEFQLLPDANEIAALDVRMNNAINSNPDLVMFLDTSKVIRIAKENVKLAEEYFYQCMKNMLQTQQAQTQQNQDATFKAQIESLKAKGQVDLDILQKKLELEGDAAKEASKNKMKEIALTGAFQVMSSKEGDVKPEWTPVINELIQNIMLPLLKDNMVHTDNLGQAINGQQSQEQPQQIQEQIQEQMQAA